MWERYRTWRQDRALAPLPEFETLTRQLGQARLRPWDAREFPVLHAWLLDMAPALAEIERASHLVGHWSPASDPLDETPTPELLKIRVTGDALRARAMHRLGEANPAVALRDLGTMIRLSAVVSDHTSLMGALIGMVVRQMALEALPQFARHPGLDVDDLVEIQRELHLDEFAAHYIVALDVERLSLLPMITTAAITGTWDREPGHSLRDEDPILRNLRNTSVEIADTVPWTQIATDYNRHFDLVIESVQAQTHAERLASEFATQSLLDGLVAETEGQDCCES